MPLVDLTLFKQHIHADDFSGEDALMEQYLRSAEDTIIAETNRSESELIEMGGGTFPARLIQAVLMLAGHFYRHPEGVEDRQNYELPYGIQVLVKPYCKLI
jgi:hypothetical protein